MNRTLATTTLALIAGLHVALAAAQAPSASPKAPTGAAQPAAPAGDAKPATAPEARPAADAKVTGEARRGAEKIAMCQGCHGIEGWRTAFPEVYHVPRIGGQHPTYLANALRAYKTGERNHPSMVGVAASLTEQDIADLAAYYGQSDVRTAAGK